MSTTATRERPILYSASMVRAILAENKTQTRRVLKPQPYDGCSIIGPEYYESTERDRHGEEVPGKEIFGVYDALGEWGIRCPYEVATKLWVRETFDWIADIETKCKNGIVEKRWIESLRYKADGHKPNSGKWTPSIFMPRWASRITLEITGVRVERVQSISEADAQGEGVSRPVLRECTIGGMRVHPMTGYYRDAYRELWDTINAKRGYSWESNPWVWVIEFKRVNETMKAG